MFLFVVYVKLGDNLYYVITHTHTLDHHYIMQFLHGKNVIYRIYTFCFLNHNTICFLEYTQAAKYSFVQTKYRTSAVDRFHVFFGDQV